MKHSVLCRLKHWLSGNPAFSYRHHSIIILADIPREPDYLECNDCHNHFYREDFTLKQQEKIIAMKVLSNPDQRLWELWVDEQYLRAERGDTQTYREGNK
jgi:hypothetical protein